MCRIKRGVSGWFSNFVQTRTNLSKLEPMVVSCWKVYPKNYFFMLSKFCFMNIFGLTGHNGAIEVRKSRPIHVNVPVALLFGLKSKNVTPPKVSRIKRGVSGWFSNFVQTRTNSSKLEPVVVSFWKVYQKNYFFMLSNFCFMNFFDLTGHNGAIEARKTSQVSRKSPSSSVIWPRIKKCHSSKGV